MVRIHGYQTRILCVSFYIVSSQDVPLWITGALVLMVQPQLEKMRTESVTCHDKVVKLINGFASNVIYENMAEYEQETPGKQTEVVLSVAEKSSYIYISLSWIFCSLYIIA